MDSWSDPVLLNYGIFGVCSRDNNVGAADGGFGGVHGSRVHLGHKLSGIAGISTPHADFFDPTDGAHRFHLTACLESASDHAEDLGLGIRHDIGGVTAGGAGSDLAEVVGFH